VSKSGVTVICASANELELQVSSDAFHPKLAHIDALERRYRRPPSATSTATRFGAIDRSASRGRDVPRRSVSSFVPNHSANPNRI